MQVLKGPNQPNMRLCSRPSTSAGLAGRLRAAQPLHTAIRHQQHWRAKAAEDDTAAEPPGPSTAQPSSPGSADARAARMNNIASSLGSQKSFVSEEEWRVMDQKVNKYPSQRVFTAIGTGGEDFKAAMLQAVEAVVGKVHVECVSERPSSGGKYVSVRVGPVWVETADQVVEVFSNMRKDARLKWYM